MRSALVLAGLLVATSAFAAETGGCSRFAWPIEADRALMAEAAMVDGGATLDLAAPKAVRVTLSDAATAGFAIAPERAPPPGGTAGVLKFEAQAGTYQITIADAPWIDLVQNGRALKPIAFAGVLDCEGARKSMRFELAAGPATLQISGAKTRTLAIAVSRLP